MKGIAVILFLGALISGFSQTTAERYEVSTAGADATTSNGGNISYTVGGLVVETSSSSTISLTEGFEQSGEAGNLTLANLRPPNAFSPDGDGVNDTWIIDLPPNLIDIVDLTIVNRWGDQIAFVENYDNNTNVWDGTYDASGEPVVAGTYFYILEAHELGGKKTGWIQVIRRN